MPRALTHEQIQDFRQQLLQVAADRFAEEGYDAVTMKAIGGALGLSAMTPYRYFESKAAIYREVRVQAFQRFGRRTREAAAGEPEPIARLRRLFEAYLQFALDEPGAYRIMFELEAPQDAEFGADEEAHAAQTWTPLLTALEDAAEAGLVRGDPSTLANLCWVQVHGLASLQIAGRLQFERSFGDLLDPLFDALLHGILARPGKEAADA